MLLGGLWHGAAWTFVIWGGLHGLMLAAHRAWRGDGRDAPPATPLGALAGGLATNACVVLAWVFFRAADLDAARAYLGGLAGAFADGPSALLSGAAIALYFGVIALLDVPPRRAGRHEFSEAWPEPVRVVFYVALIVAIWTAWPASSVPFIYFQF